MPRHEKRAARTRLGKSAGRNKPASAEAPFRFHKNSASPARLKAYECVREIRLKSSFAHEVIDRVVDSSRMSTSDKAFAAKLVLGVVSMRGSLNDVLNRALNSPKDITLEVRDALLISTYEIIYLQKSPHAAVDQGVELTRAVAPSAAGLANAVLRRIVALKEKFPFGDVSKDLSAYALLHGFPEWLVSEAISSLGAVDAHEFLLASNTIAPLFVSVNTIKDKNGEVYETLTRAKANPQPVFVNDKLLPDCYQVSKHEVLNDGRIKRLVNMGYMLVSDAAAQAVVDIVAAVSATAATSSTATTATANTATASAAATTTFAPTSFLEIGAGRGTKTIMLQSNAARRHQNQIEHFVCIDNNKHKVDLLTKRAEKYGISIDAAYTADATNPQALEDALQSQTFGTVFIDAPCTGLGTLRRHPEIRWRVSEAAIEKYAAIGLELLCSAAPFVKPNGILVFSTCTITRRENETCIEKFLASPEGEEFKLVSPTNETQALRSLEANNPTQISLSNGNQQSPYFRTMLKRDGSDAHFCAILQKRATQNAPTHTNCA